MSVAISCPACNKRYKVDESRCGKKLQCKCGHVFRAPAAPAMDAITTSPAVWEEEFPSLSDPILTTMRAASSPPPPAAAAPPPPIAQGAALPAASSAATSLPAAKSSHEWQGPNFDWAKSFQVTRNYALQCGTALVGFGLAGLILPFFG